MRTKSLFAILVAALLCGFAAQAVCGQDLDAVPPVVVKTIPEAGVAKVPPGEYEVKVTFSKEMQDRSWSWSSAWANSTPEMIGGPRYEADHKTCVLKVKLEANKTYGWWLNSQKFHGFKDVQGHAAVPYLLVFATGKKTEASAAGSAGEEHGAAEKQAVTAAESWLTLVDDGKYGESWDAAAEDLKKAVGKDALDKSLSAVRKPLGKLKSREVKSKEYRTSLPGAPDGEYVVIQFKTSLEHKESAIETVTPMLGKDKKWRVSGYFIR